LNIPNAKTHDGVFSSEYSEKHAKIGLGSGIESPIGFAIAPNLFADVL